MELRKRQPALVEMLTAFMEICTTAEATTLVRAADAGWRSTINSKGFPAFRVGTKYLINTRALQQWLNKQSKWEDA